MKQNLFKSALSLAAVFAAASSSAAVVATTNAYYGATFEATRVMTGIELNDYEYLADTSIGAYSTTSYGTKYGWVTNDVADASKIISDSGNQVLELNTEGNVLENVFTDSVADAINAAVASKDGAYFETKVKFVASEDLGVNGITPFTDNTKFAVYAYTNSNEDVATKLVIYHAYQGENDEVPLSVNEVTDVEVSTEEFTTLRFKLFAPFKEERSMIYFTVSVNGGEPLVAKNQDVNGEETWFRALNMLGEESSALVSKLCFSGTGQIDDINIGTVVEEESADGVEAEDAAGNTFTVPADVASDFAAANVDDMTATAGNGLTYAQAYALGLASIEEGEVVLQELPAAEIVIDDEGVKVKLGEGIVPAAGYTVQCELYASDTLPVATTGENVEPVDTASIGEDLTDPEASDATARFYKVVVTIVDAE